MLALLCVGILPQGIHVTKEMYRLWPSCYRITNGKIDMVVVPQIGRIMRIGFVGKRNLLWEGPRTDGKPPSGGGWMNWGGDKVWPAPQKAWGWPPETEYDGSPWEVTALSNGVLMKSKASAKLGVRFERTIAFSLNQDYAIITNTIFNASNKPVNAAPWEVCQVDDPEFCFLPLSLKSAGGKGYVVYGDGLDHDSTHPFPDSPITGISRNKKFGIKYGSRSTSGHVRASFRSFEMLSLSTKVDPRCEYPDEGCPEQIFTSADPLKYCELELTGPITLLKPGKSATLEVKMTLQDGSHPRDWNPFIKPSPHTGRTDHGRI